MAINFKEISSVIEEPQESEQKTVLEELNDRQHLLNERSIKCDSIRPFYAKSKKPKIRYYCRYFCVCPRYNPKYACKHKDNIIVDRDVLTKEEHIVYLATPRTNYAAHRRMPRFFVKKTIIANCTARIMRLAKPDKKHVTYTLDNFNNIISRRHKRSLKKLLKTSSDVEHTSIMKAVDLIREEKRLKRVAKRKERLRCQKLMRKILHKQRRQIKKIVCILFEEMKEFLLNDQFIMHENSTLGIVILEALRNFTDNEFHVTNNLREYQKTLAFNLAVWINKFISNLNIHVAENPPQHSQMPQTEKRPTEDLSTFIPVGDYILRSSASDDTYYEEENEDYYSNNPITSKRTLR